MYESSQDIGHTGGVHRTIAALVVVAALVVDIVEYRSTRVAPCCAVGAGRESL